MTNKKYKERIAKSKANLDVQLRKMAYKNRHLSVEDFCKKVREDMNVSLHKGYAETLLENAMLDREWEDG